MKALVFVLSLLALIPAGQQPQTRFVAVDLYAETGGKPLAAWQIELVCDPERARIVGVEGPGEQPPSYDPAALQGGRIILASFTTDPKPPAGRVFVARVHLHETAQAGYSARLMAAATTGGDRFEPRIDVVPSGGK